MSPESPKRDPKTTKMGAKPVQEGPDGAKIVQTGSETEVVTKKGGLRDEQLVVFGIQNGPKSKKYTPEFGMVSGTVSASIFSEFDRKMRPKRCQKRPQRTPKSLSKRFPVQKARTRSDVGKQSI